MPEACAKSGEGREEAANTPATKGCRHNEHLRVSLEVLLSLWAFTGASRDGGGKLQYPVEDQSYRPNPKTQAYPSTPVPGAPAPAVCFASYR